MKVLLKNLPSFYERRESQAQRVIQQKKISFDANTYMFTIFAFFVQMTGHML